MDTGYYNSTWVQCPQIFAGFDEHCWVVKFQLAFSFSHAPMAPVMLSVGKLVLVPVAPSQAFWPTALPAQLNSAVRILHLYTCSKWCKVDARFLPGII